MSVPGDGERRITEAEYVAWAEWKRARLAEEFTALLPQEAREAGLRLEFDESPVAHNQRVP